MYLTDFVKLSRKLSITLLNVFYLSCCLILMTFEALLFYLLIILTCFSMVNFQICELI
uniref:Uncharacterized protein n=1 Tax=Anguilla anguilla TaxID=7936 RepID=A0A0E9XQ45_ANGAN